MQTAAQQKPTKAQREKFRLVMREFRQGKLHSRDGTPIKNRKEAIAIAMEASGLDRQDTLSYQEGFFLSGIIPANAPPAYAEGVINALQGVSTKRTDARKTANPNRPTKAGYTWVESKRVKKGGYFRKLPKGQGMAQETPATRKRKNAEPKATNNPTQSTAPKSEKAAPQKSSGNGAAGLIVAGLGAAAVLAAGAAIASQSNQQANNTTTATRGGGLVAPARPQIPADEPEVVARRPATPEESSRYEAAQEKLKQRSELPERGWSIIAPPNAAKNLKEAVNLDAFSPESQAYLRDLFDQVDKTLPNIPGLSKIKLDQFTPEEQAKYKSTFAIYDTSEFADTRTGKTVDKVPNAIRLSPQVLGSSNKGKLEAAIIHEVGHMIDHAAIGDRKDGAASKSGHPAMKEFLDVASQSKTIQRLQKSSKNTKNQLVKDQFEYMTRPGEVFSRAFVQYMAQKTNNPQLRQHVKQNPLSGEYWSDRDFKPIEAAMDRMFTNLGMRQ